MLLFLSYKWEDRNYVNELDGLLNNPTNQYRHDTNREKKDLRYKGEKKWKSYIRGMIRECDALICLIGKDTHSAPGVKYELEVAISLKKKIIPLRIPGTSSGTPPLISDLDIINWDTQEINDELSRK